MFESSLPRNNTVHSQVISKSGTRYRTRIQGSSVFGQDWGSALPTAHWPSARSGLPVFGTELFGSILYRFRTNATACLPISSWDAGSAAGLCCALDVEIAQESDIAMPAKNLRKFI